MLTSADSMDAMIPVVMAQDVDAGFKGIVAEKVNHSGQSATVVAGFGALGIEHTSLSIVVFVANNIVAAKAVNTALYLARWGCSDAEAAVSVSCHGH